MDVFSTLRVRQEESWNRLATRRRARREGRNVKEKVNRAASCPAVRSHLFTQSPLTPETHYKEVNTFRSRLLATLATALLAAAPLAGAQTAPAAPTPAPRTTPAAPSSQTRAPRVGDEVFQKTRPAAFRIETLDEKGEVDGIGSGYFINKDGLALTAYHVVFRARSLRARTLAGESLPIRVVGYDDNSDLAVVQVEVKGDVPFLPLAAQAPKVGDPALAIGNGGGRFLRGEYGTLERLDVASERGDFPSGTLEVTAPLVPGDSGGPLINARGEAIGVVSYIQLGGPGEDSTTAPAMRSNANGTPRIISFAVPVVRDSTLLAALKRGEKRDAPVIGIALSGEGIALFDNLRDDAFARLGLGPKPGVLFDQVTPGGPGEKAGLRPVEIVSQGGEGQLPTLRGDVILAVDGKSVREFVDLINVVRARKVGDTIVLTVQRGKETTEVRLTLGARAQVQTTR